ncbi:L domain-like protein [Anaeromyces robustus]|uniref:L domain-like protein n=1 Tax=Anaeromyces robustus TaxID=1754192 RepID=A0A1Y1XME8_9FUNG|nr:L domain-like protein [Anaeromyces robustus]|eukprot:ORX86686.1 L domain-like protein [Anaeromyces robustus]
MEWKNANVYTLITKVHQINLDKKERKMILQQKCRICLKHLPNLGAKHLYNLEVLYVISYYSEWISLKILPDSIGNLKNLRILDLSYNRLKTLPKSIGNLKNLKKLNLSENFDFSELPDSIGNLENLHTLSLKKTNLESLPESLGNSENLTSLSVSWHMESVNSHYQSRDAINESLEHWSCPAIEFDDDMNSVSLDLSGKNLKQIPLGVYMLSEKRKWKSGYGYVYITPGLKELDVSNNQLTKIPHLLNKLDQLERLYIHNNPDLNHLPDFLWKMRSLRKLKIDGKLVKYLPNNAQVTLDDIHFKIKVKMSDDQLSNETGPYMVYLGK